MSACISRHGEYSEHTPDADWTCTLCGNVDTAGLRAEVERLRAIEAGVKSLADWHETKAEKAERFRPEVDGENRVMDKAAQVHRDADLRLRALLNPTEGETDERR